ncbi:MAG: zinc ribbon domain-containing protein [Deltaproteobacteria bacterium]|nr:zinc ribbon domain-containing protein [bacterium]MCB9477675.1 zinc ribbon domain-containing protein [Deltaproteobacteria bacterium]MCB9479569.1 zinc ribbon domain-containing protein [Deltaproteobacteria bacterium]MCB9488401.1 zinc ribbon domain-containing protein [Deltaproteobacteria bacterium]
MPIYEYECNDCSTQYEKRVSINAKEAPACPSCESKNVRKLISLSSFHLKGSGWYVTDYAAKNPGSKPATSESSSSSETASCPSGACNGTGACAAEN